MPYRLTAVFAPPAPIQHLVRGPRRQGPGPLQLVIRLLPGILAQPRGAVRMPAVSSALQRGVMPVHPEGSVQRQVMEPRHQVGRQQLSLIQSGLPGFFRPLLVPGLMPRLTVPLPVGQTVALRGITVRPWGQTAPPEESKALHWAATVSAPAITAQRLGRGHKQPAPTVSH